MNNLKKFAVLTAVAMILSSTVGARSGLAYEKLSTQQQSRIASKLESLTGIKGLTVTAKPKAVDNDDDDAPSYQLIIHNKSSYDIDSLYIAPSKNDEWGNDLLEDGATLNSGESVSVTFNPDADDYNETSWDMKIDVDGKEIVYKGIKLENSEKDEITLHDSGEYDDDEDGGDDDSGDDE